MEHKALSLLRRDKVGFADMCYPIERGTAQILYAEEDGVTLIDTVSGLCFSSRAYCEDALMELTELNPAGYALHDKLLAAMLQNAKRFTRVIRARQVLYEGKEPPHVARVCSIRLIKPEEADEMLAIMPYADEKDFKLLCEKGLMYGAFMGDEPAGYIGTHLEGCMGLLAVRNTFRRRGVGEALEAHLIKEKLANGIPAYGQIEITNIASNYLAEKLGMSFSEDETTILY